MESDADFEFQRLIVRLKIGACRESHVRSSVFKSDHDFEFGPGAFLNSETMESFE
jgi:hypothetical protein